MAGKMIDVAHHGSVAIVTLRHPPANAMSLELTEEIPTVFERLGQDSSLRSLVLSGQGNCFCAGLDLKAVPAFDVTLSWPTFSAAADQAGMSRRYGGIHFKEGDLQSRAIGRLIGAQAWAKAKEYFAGSA